MLNHAVSLGESNSNGEGAPQRVIGNIAAVAAEIRAEGATVISVSQNVRENKNGSKMILFTVDGNNYIVNTGRSVSLGDSVNSLTFGEFEIEGNTVMLAYKPGSGDTMTL